MLSDDVPSDGAYRILTDPCDKFGCIGRVWLYYKTFEHQKQWGTIRESGIGQDEKNVICRQLGYTAAHTNSFHPTTPLNHTFPVWFSDIDCRSADKTNILQCKVTPCEGSGCVDHSKDLGLSCCKYLHRSAFKMHWV